MAIGDQFQVLFDVGQTGLSSNSVTTPEQHDGFGFSWCVPNVDLNTDYWVTPLYPILQLRPLQLKREWSMTATGDYARLRKTDFNITAANWDEIEYLCGGDYFLLSKNTNEPVVTLRGYSANQAFVISFRAFGMRGDSYEAITIGFGQYTLHVYSDAQAMLQGSGLPVGGKRGRFAKTSQNISGELVTIVIQPMAGNKILFWSPTHDGGFILTNTAMDESLLDNMITTGGPLSVQFPESQGMVQAMHAVYPDSAEFVTPVRTLPYAPPADIEVEIDADPMPRVWYTGNGTTVNTKFYKADADEEIAWDGDTDAYRVQFTLTGSNDAFNSDARPNWTPFVTGFWCYFPGTIEAKENDPHDGTDDITTLSLSYSYGREGVTGSLTLRNGGEWGADDLPVSRMVEVLIGSPVFVGFAARPVVVEASAASCRMLSYELLSVLKRRAETVQLPTLGAFDGQRVEDVVRYLFTLCGADETNIVIPDLGNMRFETSGHAGTFLYKPIAGDTVGKWFDRIEQKLGYTFDERTEDGVWKVRMFHPDDPTDVVKTFQLDTPGDNAAWSFREECSEPECNILAFYWCDKDNKPCEMVITDEESLSPTGTGLREPRRVLIKEGYTRDAEFMRRQALALMARPGVMDAIRTATWQGQYHPDLFPNDTVTVTGKGDYRLLNISVEFVCDTTNAYYRPATYVGYRSNA